MVRHLLVAWWLSLSYSNAEIPNAAAKQKSWKASSCYIYFLVKHLPLSHHSCSYNTTTLCHTISLQKWEFLPFPTSFLSFPLCEQMSLHPTPFQSPDCRPSHWMLIPILCSFPAVRSWGGSLLWLLRGENWTSWNALVRLLCCYSSGGGLARRSHRHC